MHYASIVALMNFLADGIHPEIFVRIVHINDPVKIAVIQYVESDDRWKITTDLNEHTVIEDALDVVSFIFKNNYSLTDFRKEIEEIAEIEAVYLLKRYQIVRNILGKERIETLVHGLNNSKPKILPVKQIKLTLLKNEELSE